MNKDNRMDELLRQKLGGYQAEPSPGVWEGLAGRLPEPAMPAWRVWLSTLLLPVSVLVLTAGLFLTPAGQLSEYGRPVVIASQNPANIASSVPELVSQDDPITEKASVKDTPASQPLNAAPSKPAPIAVQKAAFPKTNPAPAVSKAASAYSAEVMQPSSPDPLASVELLIPMAIQPTIAISNPESASHPPTEETTDRIEDLSVIYPLNMVKVLRLKLPARAGIGGLYRTDESKAWKKTLGISGQRKSIRPVWSIGLFYIPEVYHSEDLHAEKTLYGFDGMLRYTWYNYTLETGIGISRVRNENLYTVDYNAYLGTYKDLDSIAFVVDSANQTVVPQYFFNEISVYDSITSQYFERTVNTYTYFQVPVILGYRHMMGRTTLTLRGGPMLSVLVGSKEPEIYVDDETNRILRVDDRTPGRIRTNWQFLLNAGAAYQLTQRISISLEPGIRYYLNPIYQELDTKPWSVNIRTGVIYEF